MRFTLTLFLVGAFTGLFGQYEYEFMNAFDLRFQEKEAMTVGKDRVHTGVKPLRKDDVIDMDSLNAEQPIGGWWTGNAWGRKLFNEHLVQVDAKGFKWRLDPVMNFSGGREYGPGATDAVNYVNTRGFLMEGSFGEQVSFFPPSAKIRRCIQVGSMRSYKHEESFQVGGNHGPLKMGWVSISVRQQEQSTTDQAIISISPLVTARIS